MTPLNVTDFKKHSKKSIIIDCRKPKDFANAHIPGAIFVGIDGSFAPWAASVIKDIKSQIILVVDPSRAEEAITRLSRVGIDNTLGYLKGGMNNWIKQGYKTDTVRSISPLEFEKEMDDEGNIKTTEINVFDVSNIFEGETTIITKRGKEIIEEKKQTKLDFGRHARGRNM